MRLTYHFLLNPAEIVSHYENEILFLHLSNRWKSGLSFEVMFNKTYLSSNSRLSGETYMKKKAKQWRAEGGTQQVYSSCL